MQSVLTSAIIPIAIPMMLFNSDFRKFSIRDSLGALFCGMLAITVTIVTGYFIFRGRLGAESYKIAGMLTGVYTGGTPNLAALKLMLDVDDATYIMLNTYDMLASLLYLVFLMTAGIGLFRRLLPGTRTTETETVTEEAKSSAPACRRILTRRDITQILGSFGLSAAILAVSAGIAALGSGRMQEGFGAVMSWKYFMAVLILSLTTLGIAASLVPRVRKLEKSFDAGMYLVYIFCVVVASTADLGKLDFGGNIVLLLYIVFAIFFSLTIQTLLSRLFRIDGDTMVISSVALINSPPMVPMIAAAMNNRSVIVSGLGVGIVGYAAGNYLGFAIAELLAAL